MRVKTDGGERRRREREGTYRKRLEMNRGRKRSERNKGRAEEGKKAERNRGRDEEEKEKQDSMTIIIKSKFFQNNWPMIKIQSRCIMDSITQLTWF